MRLGTFSIALDLVLTRDDIAAAVLRDCVVLDARIDYPADRVRYVARSPQFEVADVVPVPDYLWSVGTSDGTARIRWERAGA